MNRHYSINRSSLSPFWPTVEMSVCQPNNTCSWFLGCKDCRTVSEYNGVAASRKRSNIFLLLGISCRAKCIQMIQCAPVPSALAFCQPINVLIFRMGGAVPSAYPGPMNALSEYTTTYNNMLDTRIHVRERSAVKKRPQCFLASSRPQLLTISIRVPAATHNLLPNSHVISHRISY